MVQNKTKRIVANFWRSPAGNEPVREWLLALSDADRRIIGADIATAEFGWPIGMPTSRPLGSGLYEIRSTAGAGKVEARVYFVVAEGRMILLHGHLGKDRQDAEITIARSRHRDFLKQRKTNDR